MFTPENKKYILNEFFKHLFHLQDREYQERVWIRGEGPEIDEFSETVNNFSDLWDIIFERYKEFGITESQHHLLVSFQREFKAFYDEHDLPQEFIDTPEWERIMRMAKKVLEAFNYP